MKQLILTTICMFIGAPSAGAQIPCLLVDDHTLSVDQASLLQVCIDSAPDYSTIAVQASMGSGRTPKVRINSTVKIHGRTNLTLTCPGGPTYTSGAPGFYWGGPDGGTMLDTSGSSHIRVIGCNFITTITSLVGANLAILVDISASVGSTITTTDQLFDDIGIYNPGYNQNLIGIHFSPSGDANVEYMQVTNSRIQCSGSITSSGSTGVGIRIAGVTFDAIRHHYSGNSINACAEGIHAANGIPDIDNNHFEGDASCITADLGPIHIHSNDSEYCIQFFSGSSGTSVTLDSNRIAACNPPAGEGCVYAHGGVISRGNTFDSIGGSGIPISSPSNGIYLLDEGDSFPSYANFLAGAQTFYQWQAVGTGNGVGILMGGLQGGNAVVFDCNRPAAASAEAEGVSIICANGYTRTLQLSNNGSSFSNIQ